MLRVVSESKITYGIENNISHLGRHQIYEDRLRTDFSRRASSLLKKSICDTPAGSRGRSPSKF